MSKLVITRGLPGSGKTTYAKKWVSESAETRSRLNRDDLREMLHGGAHGYPRELENAVTVAHDAAVTVLLQSGRDVICDDMNLASRNVRNWRKLATLAGAEFEVVDLTNVSLDTCIDRDLQRHLDGGRFVGADYISGKHAQFIKGKPYPLPVYSTGAMPLVPRPYVAPKGKPDAILVDIDGTMALMNGRGPFEWHRVGEDLPNEKVVNLLRILRDHSTEMYEPAPFGEEIEIIFMSGRDEVCRPETEAWLAKQGFPIDMNPVGWSGKLFTHRLYMRPSLPDGVQQPGDEIVKLALFDEHIRDI